MFGCVWTELSTLSKSTWAMPNRILYIFRNKPLYCLDSVYFLISKHLINILWYKSLTYIFDINRPHMFTTKMEWFYNGTLNWKAHLFLFRLGQNLVTRHKKVLFISTIFLPLFFSFSDMHQFHHLDGRQAMGINCSFTFDFWTIRFWYAWRHLIRKSLSSKSSHHISCSTTNQSGTNWKGNKGYLLLPYHTFFCVLIRSGIKIILPAWHVLPPHTFPVS